MQNIRQGWFATGFATGNATGLQLLCNWFAISGGGYVVSQQKPTSRMGGRADPRAIIWKLAAQDVRSASLLQRRTFLSASQFSFELVVSLWTMPRPSLISNGVQLWGWSVTFACDVLVGFDRWLFDWLPDCFRDWRQWLVESLIDRSDARIVE